MKKIVLLALVILGGVMQTNADNYLKGDWDNWVEHKVDFDGSIGTVTINNLAANTTYEFGLIDGNSNSFYKNIGTMTIDKCSNWAFTTSANNAKITTTVAGDYTFKVVWISSAPHIWVVYPDQGQYVVHFNNYGSWESINSHLYLIGTDVKGNAWPGASVTTSNTNNAGYFDFTINDNFYNGIIFSNNGNYQTSNLTISYNDAREFWITNSSTISYIAPEGWIGYTRSVTPGNFGTICLPFAATIEGAIIYKIASKVTKKVGENDQLTAINLDEVTGTLEAGHAYIFKATGDMITATYSGSYTNAIEADGMIGNLNSNDVTVPTGKYVVNGNQLREVALGGSGVTCGQYRAYITLDGIGEATSRGTNFISFEEATGIENIQAENGQNVVYNLQGQRVTDAQKGLVIVGGKKMLRK